MGCSSSRLQPITPWHATVLNAKPSTSKYKNNMKLIKPQEIGLFTSEDNISLDNSLINYKNSLIERWYCKRYNSFTKVKLKKT